MTIVPGRSLSYLCLLLKVVLVSMSYIIHHDLLSVKQFFGFLQKISRQEGVVGALPSGRLINSNQCDGKGDAMLVSKTNSSPLHLACGAQSRRTVLPNREPLHDDILSSKRLLGAVRRVGLAACPAGLIIVQHAGKRWISGGVRVISLARGGRASRPATCASLQWLPPASCASLQWLPPAERGFFLHTSGARPAVDRFEAGRLL
jgi:hypothetical protein